MRIWIDLENLSESLHIGILKHYFSSFRPSESVDLRETIGSIHMGGVASSDYRSAYHQFCDWMYGWTVTDAEAVKRPPREIYMSQEKEILDAQRLMKNFETLTTLNTRKLKLIYNDIEAEMPRLGQGIETFSNIQKVEDEEKNEFNGQLDGNIWTAGDPSEVRIFTLKQRLEGRS